MERFTYFVRRDGRRYSWHLWDRIESRYIVQCFGFHNRTEAELAAKRHRRLQAH